MRFATALCNRSENVREVGNRKSVCSLLYNYSRRL